MRIYTKRGDLAFSTFTFPDGQPHFKLETHEVDFRSVTIETAIKSPRDLLLVVLASDVLRNCGYNEIRLDIRYLLGARMDRAIGLCEPFTLELVARIINSCGFSKVRILDVHSEVALRLIRNSENVLPQQIVFDVQSTLSFPKIVCPDKGAIGRVEALFPYDQLAYCGKIRDPHTGRLSGFEVSDLGDYKHYLIVDDICDGGGTFIGLAAEIRKHRPDAKIFLYVTHGIFSKGLPLAGIDEVYTTDSYFGEDQARAIGQEHMPIVIPISMKEI